MQKIKLIEQPVYEFKCEMQVRASDINYGSHVGSREMTGFIQDARELILHSFNMTHYDLGDRKTGFVIGDLVINFRSEACMFDILKIETHFAGIDGSNFRVFNKISKDGKIIALAETGIIAFNYKERQKEKFPEKFIEKFNASPKILDT